MVMNSRQSWQSIPLTNQKLLYSLDHCVRETVRVSGLYKAPICRVVVTRRG